MRKLLSRSVFSVRWLLFPVNVGLVLALLMYLATFFSTEYHFFQEFLAAKEHDLESGMVMILGFIDASMVANLVVMIVQGGHQIFITRFEENRDRPQWMDHIDTGILKVKVAMSISSITLIQLLKDFANIEKVPWELSQHRLIVHGMTLLSAFAMAKIWQVMHAQQKGDSHEAH